MKTALVLVSATLALTPLACASARIAGGDLVAPGAEPSGDVVARFRVGRCEDAHRGRIPEEESRVSVVREGGGRFVLVERRPGYDSLVVTNGWAEGDTRVFQVAYKRAAGGPYVREYRTPVDVNSFGRLAVVSRVRRWHESSRGFHARYVNAELVCDLSPDA